MEENELSSMVIGCAIKVHKSLGPGLLESAYETCLNHELRKTGLKVEKQKPLPLIYEGQRLEIGYRVDFLIEDRLVVEIKAVELLHSVHLAQVITYLKLSDCKLGLLINFNVTLVKDGIKRVINSA